MNIDGPYILSDSMNTYLVIKVSFPSKQIKCTYKIASSLNKTKYFMMTPNVMISHNTKNHSLKNAGRIVEDRLSTTWKPLEA